MPVAIREIVIPILGEYTPEIINTTNEIVNADLSISTYMESVVIPDYAWIAGCIAFLITIFCILKMVGGLLKWKV